VVWLGQPMTENGNRPEENHVSRTSGSCSSLIFSGATSVCLALALAFSRASSRERPTTQLF
jgi:hypothetical protein